MTLGGLPLYTIDPDADAGAVTGEHGGRPVSPAGVAIPGAPSSEPAPGSGS